jgi:succinyl-CoA synthetase alpha subunit
MSILLDAETRILLHGIADPLGRYQCSEMLRYGTALVGVVEPAPEVAATLVPPGVPIFASAPEAVRTTGANFSLVFSPPLAVLAVVSEAFAAGIRTAVCMTEHVPAHDTLALQYRARQAGAVLLGPNSSGVYAPAHGKAGFFCRDICLPGRIGVVTKSGSLAYAVMCEMRSAGLGVSTVIATGGDLLRGLDFREALTMFDADAETDAVVLLGEIGGNEEEKAAALVGAGMTKPVVAFISGRSSPPGQSMGHAGAIAERGRGDYPSKVGALRGAGIRVAENIGEVVSALRDCLAAR